MYNPSNKGWMKHLNGDVRVNLNNQTEIDANKNNQMLLELANRYEDDSELHLFGREVFKVSIFSHDKLVFTKIFSKDNLNCSLTLRWLLKYWRNYNDIPNINTIAVQKCLQLISPDPIVITTATATTTTTRTTTTTTTSTTAPSSSKNFHGNNFKILIIFVSIIMPLFFV
jgi:hypothetical protein